MQLVEKRLTLRAHACEQARRERDMAEASLRCLLESGVWLEPWSNATAASRCCGACVRLESCTSFDLIRGDICIIDRRHGNSSSAAIDGLVRGLVLRFEVVDDSESVPPGRQLRQQFRRRSRSKRPALRLPATCTPWRPFKSSAMAARCAASIYPQRHVLRECGQANYSIHSALAIAQGAHFFMRSECGSTCLHHPETPATAGWVYEQKARCFRPWRSGRHERDGFVHPQHACVRALLDAPTELARLVGTASRACPLSPSCRKLVSVSSTALRASGCPPRHHHRNLTNVCSAEQGGGGGYTPAHANGGSPSAGGVSIDLARAQVRTSTHLNFFLPRDDMSML